MKKIILLSNLLLVLVSCNKDDDNFNNEKWEKLNTNTTETITTISFYNDNFGIALIPIGNTLVTNDGGDNWNKINVVSNENFTSCFALNSEISFVARNRFFKSNNGGQNYTELGQNQIDYSSSIFGIHFFDNQNGLVLKGGSIYKTHDGGQNWENKYHQFGFSSLMEVCGNETIYLAGGETYDNVTFGELHKSIDNGENWDEIFLPDEIDNSQITSIDFITDQIGVLSTFENKIFKTINGGNNWLKIYERSSRVYDLTFINEKVGYLISYKKIHKTDNGGISWSVDFESNDEIFQLEKTPNATFFAIGRNGTILKKK